MPHQKINSDSSLLVGSDGIRDLKKEIAVAYYENETTSSQTTGLYANGNVLRWDWFNSVPNSALVESNLHMTVKNGGADNIELFSLASLIAKMTIFINNVEVMKIQNSDVSEFLNQLSELKRTSTLDEFIIARNRNQGRTAANPASFVEIAAASSRNMTLNLNDLLNNMFYGLDPSKCQKCSIEITWRTDSGAANQTKFIRNTANNTDMYATLEFTNSFVRNKYIILPEKYITKSPISKQMIQLEKQNKTMNVNQEYILKLDDIFSLRKRSSALLVVMRPDNTTFNSADSFKSNEAYQLSYKIFKSGKEEKDRSNQSDAQHSSLSWIDSLNGVLLDPNDGPLSSYVPWISGVVPLSNIYQKDETAEHIRGITNSPQSNVEVHLTLKSAGTPTTSIELYLVYSELLVMDGKSVKVFT